MFTFLLALAWFAPRFAGNAAQLQQLNAKTPFLRERIEQADPQQLHKDAIVLLTTSEASSETIQTMEKSVIHLTESFCVIITGLTTWLGAILFKLHRSHRNQNGPSTPS